MPFAVLLCLLPEFRSFAVWHTANTVKHTVKRFAVRSLRQTAQTAKPSSPWAFHRAPPMMLLGGFINLVFLLWFSVYYGSLATKEEPKNQVINIDKTLGVGPCRLGHRTIQAINDDMVLTVIICTFAPRKGWSLGIFTIFPTYCYVWHCRMKNTMTL